MSMSTFLQLMRGSITLIQIRWSLSCRRFVPMSPFYKKNLFIVLQNPKPGEFPHDASVFPISCEPVVGRETVVFATFNGFNSSYGKYMTLKQSESFHINRVWAPLPVFIPMFYIYICDLQIYVPEFNNMIYIYIYIFIYYKINLISCFYAEPSKQPFIAPNVLYIYIYKSYLMLLDRAIWAAFYWAKGILYIYIYIWRI